MPGILRRTRVYLELTLRPPGYFVDFLNFASDFAPDQLSDSGKLASFQFVCRVSRMEHQTPSVFPGNFRKRKVLGTLCFPFCFPENLVEPNSLARAGDGAFSRERGHARRVACGWDASRDGCGGRWEPIHSRVIRNKNLACDDSERVRDRPREGLSLPYSPCLSSGSTEVGLNIALSVWTTCSMSRVGV